MENRGPFRFLARAVPDNRISGDKVLGKGTRRVVNRAATALRQAANTLVRSRSYLGAQYRRLRTRLGAPKAITAMAHRLARLVYRMLKYGQPYLDKGTEYYEERLRQQQIQSLRKRAANSDFMSPRLTLEREFLERESQEQNPPRRWKLLAFQQEGAELVCATIEFGAPKC